MNDLILFCMKEESFYHRFSPSLSLSLTLTHCWNETHVGILKSMHHETISKCCSLVNPQFSHSIAAQSWKHFQTCWGWLQNLWKYFLLNCHTWLLRGADIPYIFNVKLISFKLPVSFVEGFVQGTAIPTAVIILIIDCFLSWAITCQRKILLTIYHSPR